VARLQRGLRCLDAERDLVGGGRIVERRFAAARTRQRPALHVLDPIRIVRHDGQPRSRPRALLRVSWPLAIGRRFDRR